MVSKNELIEENKILKDILRKKDRMIIDKELQYRNKYIYFNDGKKESFLSMLKNMIFVRLI